MLLCVPPHLLAFASTRYPIQLLTKASKSEEEVQRKSITLDRFMDGGAKLCMRKDLELTWQFILEFQAI